MLKEEMYLLYKAILWVDPYTSSIDTQTIPEPLSMNLPLPCILIWIIPSTIEKLANSGNMPRLAHSTTAPATAFHTSPVSQVTKWSPVA